MDWVNKIQKAVDYVEEHLTENIALEEVAAQALVSSYHFHRVFSILCGQTLGEYIRLRRLTLAGIELAENKAKVIDVALKYGYDSPDSFTKAFQKFHGISPSQARVEGAKLKSFSRLFVKISLEGGSVMDYKIEKRPEMTIVGKSKLFVGLPKERFKQQHDFMVNGDTRFIRYALQGLSKDCTTEYAVVSDIEAERYRFTVGTQIANYYVEHLGETVENHAEQLAVIKIPANTYVRMETKRSVFCMEEHVELYRRLVEEWLPSSGYILANAPEITIMHSFENSKNDCYVELLIPIKKKG